MNAEYSCQFCNTFETWTQENCGLILLQKGYRFEWQQYFYRKGQGVWVRARASR